MQPWTRRCWRVQCPGVPCGFSGRERMSYVASRSIESFMDELAELAGCDAVEFRLRHLTDARARRVVSRVVEISDYSKPCGAGFGRGLGFARFKNTGSYCAVVAFVSVDEAVTLHKLWAVVDAGLVINPAGVVSQSREACCKLRAGF